MKPTFDRRTMLRYLAGAAVTGAWASGCDPESTGTNASVTAPGYDASVSSGSPLTFHSPPIPAFVDAMPRLSVTRGSSFDVTARNAVHRFHRDLPKSKTFAYGSATYLGPVLEAQRDVPTLLAFHNQLGPHVFADDIDTTIHGGSDADKTTPRSVLHLHGGVSPPASDGHPEATLLPGESFTHRYPNGQEAACLWYHDHAMGITRLNAYAGLASLYLLRDAFDTGRSDNPLGLPAGDYELPLVLQEKVFDRDGYLQVRTTPVVPQGNWEGGGVGDVGVVNGVCWPELRVARGLYRFRMINAGSFSVWNLYFDNRMRFWVIGNDAGLLDAPVATTSLKLSPGERADVLVDFSGLSTGDSVVLCNDEPPPGQAAILGQIAMPFFCRFKATSSRGFRGAVPSTLRGGPRQPPRLEPLPAPVKVRNLTLSQRLEVRFPPAIMTLNNLEFTTDDLELPRQGTIEQWNFINTTPDPHPMHVHLAQMRLLGRQAFVPSLYVLANPRPPIGTRWTPSAEPFVKGPMAFPAAWEAGPKDTVRVDGHSITRVLVRFPTEAELGFDPDAPFHPTGAVHHAGTGEPLQGYVWHCHIFDHEDHDMMLRFRTIA